MKEDHVTLSLPPTKVPRLHLPAVVGSQLSIGRRSFCVGEGSSVQSEPLHSGALGALAIGHRAPRVTGCVWGPVQSPAH